MVGRNLYQFLKILYFFIIIREKKSEFARYDTTNFSSGYVKFLKKISSLSLFLFVL